MGGCPIPWGDMYKPKAGDVINTTAHPGWKVWLYPLVWAIQFHQRKRGFKNWKHTHTMLYFSDSCILSVTFPRAKWETWKSVQKRDWSAYRPVMFSWETSKHQCIPEMLQAGNRFIGTKYDFGQLLDMALNRILGYKVSNWRTWFDADASLKVCSVGARACFEAGRKVFCRLYGFEPYERLWASHVERTPPAAFANSDKFEHVGSR